MMKKELLISFEQTEAEERYAAEAEVVEAAPFQGVY